jgi:DNA polymerase-3 subunit epsilon
LHHDRWVAIDFETATREPTSACALGVAVIDGLEVVVSASWLIRPPFNEYEFWNTNVHGISAEDTELAPDFDELWWEVAALLSGVRLLAHNAGFDMRVLRALIETRELSAPAFEYACTVTVARKAWPHLANHRLDTVCDHCGIGLVHHDAASDALGCAHVAIECARSAGAGSIADALGRLGVETRRLAT